MIYRRAVPLVPARYLSRREGCRQSFAGGAKASLLPDPRHVLPTMYAVSGMHRVPLLSDEAVLWRYSCWPLRPRRTLEIQSCGYLIRRNSGASLDAE